MRKAQSNIVGAVIIVAIALSLATTAYLWGIPLIQKRQDSALVERVHSYFSQDNENSLPNVIEDIANNGGEKTFFANANGIWILNQSGNYIQFTFLSRASKFATDTIYSIPLTPGEDCSQLKNGTLGIDKASVVCVRADTIADKINITYRVWFRTLYDDPSNPTRGYKITLNQSSAGLSTSTEKNIRISFSKLRQDVNLITREIEILLI